ANVQVVRCFESEDIHHVDGSVDPLRDIEVINTELLLADMGAMERRRTRNEKKAKGGDKEAIAEIGLIDRLLPHMNEGKPASTLEMDESERGLLKVFALLTSKPTIFACNVSEDELSAALSDPDKHPYVSAVAKYAAETHGAQAVVISASIEEELVDLSEEESEEYLKSVGAETSGVSELIRAVYALLGLRTYLTTGEKETRAWTIPEGAKAPQAAGVIHTDFERGFIAAEVVSFEDLSELGSQAKAREAGKLRIEGKEYQIQDGDVVEFRFNV
ncbi:MAG: redox-regulated ATPase YchF, partial [Verrucomicrobiota bacterium]